MHDCSNWSIAARCVPARVHSARRFEQRLQRSSRVDPARPLRSLVPRSLHAHQRRLAFLHGGRRPRPDLPVQVRRPLHHFHHPLLRRRRRCLLHGEGLFNFRLRQGSEHAQPGEGRPSRCRTQYAGQLNPRSHCPSQLEVLLPFVTGFFADDGSYRDTLSAAAWRNLSSPLRFWPGPPRHAFALQNPVFSIVCFSFAPPPEPSTAAAGWTAFHMSIHMLLPSQPPP